jgi:trans-aconitate 2-methyltransferase
MVSTWDPDQYERFAADRRRPFDDLLAMVEPIPGGAVVDLGCGTGALTAELHRHTGAAQTVGIDSSPAMLERAVEQSGLRFELGDIAAWHPPDPVDVVFANASLQWVLDHEALLPRLAAQLAPGGQLAVHVPANFDHPTHTVADELGAARGLARVHAFEAVLAPERYAELLHEIGLREQHVRLQVYGIELERTADVVEWTKGTLLTPYRAALDDDAFVSFIDEYRERVLHALGDRSGDKPFFYAFKRILMRARKPS